MKMRLKTNLLYTGVALSMVFASCNDFLDKKPLSSVTPQDYLNTEADLAAYAINYYPFSTHSGWGLGTLVNDNNTDNSLSSSESTMWQPGQWRVPENGSLGFGNIRACNYFMKDVLPKWKEGKISGTEENIKHYIGEMYFIRAYNYYLKLKTYGDFPIVTEVLNDNLEELTEVSKRRPRNEVARYVLGQLDTAIMYLKPEMKNKNRITKNVAYLFKSRVALYEASWLTYHRGTPRVPGEQGWPGASASYNSGFSINLGNEINFFLDQAMGSAKVVAEAVELTENNHKTNPNLGELTMGNPYFDMYAAIDMGKYDEVLLWRAYSGELSITHAVSVYIRSGGNFGLTKGYVDGFLMKNGLPIYAAGSGYHGDETLMEQKQDRDERLQLFMAGEDDILLTDNDSSNFGYPDIIAAEAQSRAITGLRIRKCYSYDPAQAPSSGQSCTYGSIVYRGVEAYLNYMEACYMKNKSLDAYASKYWKAIRNRAGVDPDYQKTINATNMSIEAEGDWGAYSGGQLVDATLFNIRRERRNEFIGEGMRWDDLYRWRALDQVDGYIVEGFNLWDKAYLAKEYKAEFNEDGEQIGGIIEAPQKNANVSSRTDSKYLRPFRRDVNNVLYNGYKWTEAYYLDPIPLQEMRLVSPDGTTTGSPLYQNPYWPTSAGPALQ